MENVMKHLEKKIKSYDRLVFHETNFVVYFLFLEPKQYLGDLKL